LKQDAKQQQEQPVEEELQQLQAQPVDEIGMYLIWMALQSQFQVQLEQGLVEPEQAALASLLWAEVVALVAAAA
jgi:hypothetical protein